MVFIFMKQNMNEPPLTIKSFLENIHPPLRDNVLTICETMRNHDVQLSDLFDGSFSSNHLSLLGITHVGTQLRILRAIRSYTGATAPRRRPSTSMTSMTSTTSTHHLSNNEHKSQPRQPSHVGLGMSIATLESLQSPYLCKILAIMTPHDQHAWQTFSKPLGNEILRRVHLIFQQAPLKTFELPIIINMLLRTPATSRRRQTQEKQDDLLTTDNVVDRLLPDAHHPSYQMFCHASPHDVETLVLVFDKDLLDAYSANPHHLALAMEESVALRLGRHSSTSTIDDVVVVEEEEVVEVEVEENREEEEEDNEDATGGAARALPPLSLSPPAASHNIFAIMTPSDQQAWQAFSKPLGKEILRRVKIIFAQHAVSNELSININMLLQMNNNNNNNKSTQQQENGQENEQETGQEKGQENEQDDLTLDNVVRYLLPDSFDPSYQMFYHALPDNIETLVLVFDQDLIDAYSINPHHLALAMEESVALRSTTKGGGGGDGSGGGGISSKEERYR